MLHLPTVVKATSPEPQRNARCRDSSPPLSEAPVRAREYVLVEEVGSGGTSKVYRAQSMDGRDVAVKLATGAVSSKISEAHACSLIRRETIALEKADHDSSISLIDSGVFDDKRFMVTELLEGVGSRLSRREGRVGIQGS